MRTARLTGLLALAATALTLHAGQALAAGAPIVVATYPTSVGSTSARLNAEVNPNELATTVRFEYLSAAEYEANLKGGKDPFAGALKAPAGSPTSIGSGNTPQKALQQVASLKPATAYRFRIVAVNSEETVQGPVRSFVTESNAPVFALPDNRGWEMVSPVDKNGGEIEGPEGVLGGGVFQAAAQGGSVTYSTGSSFGLPPGFPGSSQYLASRGPTAWSAENVTPALFSGSYDTTPGVGTPFRVFAADLGLGLVTNGKRCRTGQGECPVANPPLPGSGAPGGYRNFYLRQSAGGAAQAVLTTANSSPLTLGADQFEAAFAGATPDLGRVVISSCAAITAEATEISGPEGCDPTQQNLYLFSGGTLKLLNLLPGESAGTPGAKLAAQGGAISADGNRVYFTHSGNLYLREGSQSFQVDETQGGGGAFETASADGSVALFSKGEHLYRFVASSKAVSDLTPGGELKGVLGTSSDASRVYFLTTDGLQLWNAGGTTKVAPVADVSNYPPATGTARVSADGTRLAFLASAQIGDYENAGQPEVYLHTLGQGLACVSCNPTGERPLGPASMPGAIRNGSSLRIYKPRNLVADGARLYFDSFDGLVPQDSNNDWDVYQWEAQGIGTCTTAGGCVNLISNGRSEGGARFIDASTDGTDVFFTTDGSLVTSDPGSVDLYDARVNGGFPAPPVAIPCLGDSCQPLPPEPEDPAVGTLLSKPQGNPPLTFPKEGKKNKKGKKAGKGKKGKKKAGKAKRGKGGSR